MAWKGGGGDIIFISQGLEKFGNFMMMFNRWGILGGETEAKQWMVMENTKLLT